MPALRKNDTVFTANRISGKVYLFDANSRKLERLSLTATERWPFFFTPHKIPGMAEKSRPAAVSTDLEQELVPLHVAAQFAYFELTSPLRQVTSPEDLVEMLHLDGGAIVSGHHASFAPRTSICDC